MNTTFKGVPVTLKEFTGKTFSLLGFEVDDVLWLLLDEALAALHLTYADLYELREEDLGDFDKLDDGREVIKENGFYYLALFVSEAPETKEFASKEFASWIFGRVMPSVMEKGYYSVEG